MVTHPEDLHPRLCEAYNASDLETVLALYDPRAVYVIKPGRVTDGPAELRAAMTHNIELCGRLAIQPRSFVRSGDLVLVLGQFTLSGRRHDGTPFERVARFADVLRRQPDGGWRLAVDNPFGDE